MHDAVRKAVRTPLEHGCGPRGCSVTGRRPSGRHRGRPSIGRRRQGSWCASNLIKSAQLTLGLPSKPIQTFHVLKPSAIRRARASEMNALGRRATRHRALRAPPPVGCAHDLLQAESLWQTFSFHRRRRGRIRDGGPAPRRLNKRSGRVIHG